MTEFTSAGTPKWYSAAPEFGLDGGWTPEIRLSGLDGLVAACRGKSILDLGAAEGLVARHFLRNGAAMVHGFEVVPDRVLAARRICQEFNNAFFWQADLSDWAAFCASHAEHLLVQYDFVLYLGLHHHLPVLVRGSTLEGASTMSRDVFALRTPDACFDGDHVAEQLGRKGFLLFEEDRRGSPEIAPLRVFKRSTSM